MGCQMNEYDSDYLAQLLQSSGYNPAEEPAGADLIFINTCTVRAKPVQKAYSLLGRMLALKKRKSSLIIGMLGCIAQQEPVVNGDQQRPVTCSGVRRDAPQHPVGGHDGLEAEQPQRSGQRQHKAACERAVEALRYVAEVLHYGP